MAKILSEVLKYLVNYLRLIPGRELLVEVKLFDYQVVVERKGFLDVVNYVQIQVRWNEFIGVC